MRWLVAAVIALVVAAGLFVPEAETATTLPIRVAVVIPKDYPLYAPREAICGKVKEWTQRMQQWWVAQAGVTFNYELACVDSPLTIYEMQTYIQGSFDGCSGTPIPEGWLGTDVFGIQSLGYQATGWAS